MTLNILIIYRTPHIGFFLIKFRLNTNFPISNEIYFRQLGLTEFTETVHPGLWGKQAVLTPRYRLYYDVVIKLSTVQACSIGSP